jgi:hypothetical protein
LTPTLPHPILRHTTPTSPMSKIKARAKDTKEIRIKLVIQAFNNKPPRLSIRCAAARYGIARTTLQTRLKEVRSRSAGQAEKQILTPDEEQDIERCIEISDDMAIPRRAIDVYQMVAAIVAKRPRGQTVPANKSPKGIIGKQWLSQFLDRHPELACRFAGRIDNQRLVADLPAGMKSYRSLIFGDNSSHLTLEVLDYSQAHKIEILCSPGLSTHLLEPSDNAIFAPLGTCYRNEVDVWTRTHPYQSIKKGDFFPMCQLLSAFVQLTCRAVARIRLLPMRCKFSFVFWQRMWRCRKLARFPGVHVWGRRSSPLHCRSGSRPLQRGLSRGFHFGGHGAGGQSSMVVMGVR